MHYAGRVQPRALHKIPQELVVALEGGLETFEGGLEMVGGGWWTCRRTGSRLGYIPI